MENPNHPLRDPNLEITLFVRNKEQNHKLGVFTREEVGEESGDKVVNAPPLPAPSQFTLEDLQGEVLQFPTNCPECAAPCKTNMKLTSILFYFVQLVYYSVYYCFGGPKMLNFL